MIALQVNVFGRFEARLPDGCPLKFETRKTQALLAFLACRPEARHARDHLAAMLWSDREFEAARHSLRQALVWLRKALGDSQTLLLTDRESVALAAYRIDSDIAIFEKVSNSSNADELETAAQLYRGPLLDGFCLREEPYDEWLTAERSRVHGMAVQLLLRLSQSTGSPSVATAALFRAIELDPTNEEAHRRLMQMHVASARYNLAIRQYHACAKALQHELEATPEEETKALHREALAALRD